MVAVLLLAGCSALVDRATERFASDLETAIRGYSDPGVVADGLPAYLLLLEARINGAPEEPSLRLSAARLTGTYAALFADEDARYRRLNDRALQHARIGACAARTRLCELHRLDFDAFDARIDSLDPDDLDALYILATTWTGWIDANASDYRALGDLPRVERLLDWVAQQSPRHDDGAVWLYLAVLNSQRPPAAGGQPERARAYFERAREVSSGDNLLVNVLMADSYARLLFDRDLYVTLLEEVVSSDVQTPDYRLSNQVARARAADLLQQTEAIFD
ncbi:TRAP transporter TatT component family protein [Wenzhouxiangella marina]|nr:TRAP transporter TatT component family protein [Wenzhouxiangella marina]